MASLTPLSARIALPLLSGLIIASAVVPGRGVAAILMPDFASVPSGWATDRYDPTSFSNVGTYAGRSDVLGIGISDAGNLGNRPAAYQSSFYNTQGRQHAVSGGAGSSVSADLYVPAAWGNSTNGSRRSDAWGIMVDGAPAPAVVGYPIIGFTNYGGLPRLRAWDFQDRWINLSDTVNYDAWNTLAFVFAGTSVEYRVNGALAYTETNPQGAHAFSAVIMQAYNFGDPAVTGALTNDYTAHWSNTPVPEPTSMALLLAGLLGLSVICRRRTRTRFNEGRTSSTNSASGI